MDKMQRYSDRRVTLTAMKYPKPKLPAHPAPEASPRPLSPPMGVPGNYAAPGPQFRLQTPASFTSGAQDNPWGYYTPQIARSRRVPHGW